MGQEVKMEIDEFVSKRINITLPDSVVEELENWAEAQGRSLANLAAFLLEACQCVEFVLRWEPERVIDKRTKVRSNTHITK